ncbi:hypothetical protein MNR01_06710 [Lysobacter sp. S4-A87]|uniref:hypothetical protein n=1 Tax=Lysobacter sp. S4-A87 TaxID=2925843 RepID=UPI001F534874|nr:hypothetical protein [Lysobacter sp. S4-A87]UNK50692.1 hypothetical protein MNR01_06710 [Lysobacter sp. S4-A87]
MQWIAPTFATLIAMSATATHAAPAKGPDSGQRPIWSIAHRVLTTGGVTTAVDHGANAIEIDMTAWKDGWWADHDGLPTSKGDTAEAMFEQIARERRAGRTISFVWLDIKNPNHCRSDRSNKRHCSVAGLRDLARRKLHPVGVKVLYGFYGSKAVGGTGWNDVVPHFIDDEAAAVSGEYRQVRAAFDRHYVPSIRRVMDYGYFNIPFQFGNCREPGYYTCTEIRQGADATRAGEFARTFSWTTTARSTRQAHLLLDNGADGLIHGFKATYYYDHKDTRKAARDILDYVQARPWLRMATMADSPFGT